MSSLDHLSPTEHSSSVPDKMQKAIQASEARSDDASFSKTVDPMVWRSFRLKKEQCLPANFYVRGDGARVDFSTQDEQDTLFTTAGLKKVQNLVHRRLQVNRGKQLSMDWVWIQCKYRRPLLSSAGWRGTCS